MSLEKDYLKDLFTDEVKGCLKGDFSGSYNDLSDKPTIPTVPSKVSAFTNDAGYLTQHQDISGKADASDLTAHTGNSTVHITADERTKWNKNTTDISNLSEEIVDYLPKNQGASNVGKILVVGTDGNLTLTDMPEGGASGDVIGTLDEANNILLSGNLADGTYTLKYENKDGTYTEIGTLQVGAIPEPEPEPTNLFVVGGDGYILNGRCSSTGADRTDSPGCITTNYIEVKNGDTVYIENAAVTQSTYSGMKLTDGSTIGLNIRNSEYITNFSESGGITQFTVNKADAAFIRICLNIASAATTDEYVASMGIIITVNEPLS